MPATTDRRKGRYWVPGDPRTYVLPGDAKALDDAWDRHLKTKSDALPVEERDPAREVDMSPEAIAERERQKARHAEAMAFVRTYTGTFGLILDIKARLDYGTKHLKLSPRQVDVILASRDRDIAWAAQRSAVPAPMGDEERERFHATGRDPRPDPITAGIYKLPDGTIAKVQKAIHGSGNLYAKQLMVSDSGGTFQYAPGLINRLTAADRMPLEEAAAFGKLYGWCIVCGRTLTDEKSIAAGIGPVCAKRV